MTEKTAKNMSCKLKLRVKEIICWAYSDSSENTSASIDRKTYLYTWYFFSDTEYNKI